MSQQMYRIKDWRESFENNRTKELKRMSWVPVPNKHDGDGYTALIRHKQGAAHLGAWLAILQVASKCDPRGSLVRANHKAHTPATISRMTGLPEAVLQDAIERLLDEEIGWLEVIDSAGVIQIPQEDATPPQEAARNGKKERKEWNPEFFERFWSAYPRKVGKGNARKAWQKHGCDTLIDVIMTALDKYKLCRQWQKDSGDFIPHPATWLNGSRWEDDPDTTATRRRRDVAV
jgi:hypothetical protein